MKAGEEFYCSDYANKQNKTNHTEQLLVRIINIIQVYMTIQKDCE